MLTKEQALTASEFHHGNCVRLIGKRGGIKESITAYRRNGRTQTWKRDSERYRVPIKRGLRDYADITPDRAAEWHTAEDCPLLATEGEHTAIEHLTRIQPVTVPILARTFYRAVCTCGFHSTEHFFEFEASKDCREHLASVES